MLNEQNLCQSKYYFPICREIGCNGNLRLYINEYNFSIDYKCEKIKSHKGHNIFFKTFERFYLKEKEYERCSKCNLNIENSCIYKCKECEKIYCSLCFLNDYHIKRNFNNLITKSNKCPIHQREFINYCVNCEKKFCIYCLKNNEKGNKEHNVKNILDHMPSLAQINSLKKKIKKKSEIFEKIINSINKWQNKLNKKLHKLKENLKNEIKILEKLFLNFNQDYVNHTYYSNFYYFNENIEAINNKYLNNILLSQDFEEETKNIINLLFYNDTKIKKEFKKGILKKDNYIGEDGLIEKFTDNLFFSFSYFERIIKLVFYNDEKNETYYYENSKIEFRYRINSVSFSLDKKRIYACLLNKKIVKIFDYNDKEGSLKLSNEEICNKNDLLGNFYKCIELFENFVATLERASIYLWSKISKNSKKYSIIYNINLDEKIYDLLLISSKCFIYNQNNKISFFNFYLYEHEKIISNIDCIDTINSLLLFKEYIIVTCHKGIALISIKTKELIQYIENCGDWDIKNICKINENLNYIYLLNDYDNISIIKLMFTEGSFIEIEEINTYEEVGDSNNSLNNSSTNSYRVENILVNNDKIILWGEYIYILKEIKEIKENDN